MDIVGIYIALGVVYWGYVYWDCRVDENLPVAIAIVLLWPMMLWADIERWCGRS